MIHFNKKLISSRYSIENFDYTNLDKQSLSVVKEIKEKIKSTAYCVKEHNCLLCNNDKFEIISEIDRFGLELPVVICVNCGMLQTNPRLLEENYSDFYSNYFPFLYKKHRSNSISQYFQEEKWRADEIIKFIKNIGLEKNSLILDVGCGAGGILFAFKSLGYRTVGIDFESDKLKYGISKGMELKAGNIHTLELSEKPKLIIYSHVLEHIYDLPKELNQIRNILADDGYLYIEVPGIRNIFNYYQSDFLKSFHIAHIFHFDLSLLEILLRKHGFVLEKGNEYVRAIFVKLSPKTKRHNHIVSHNNYQSLRDFIDKTEVNIKFNQRLLKFKHIALFISQKGKQIIIDATKKIGIFSLLKRIYTKIF